MWSKASQTLWVMAAVIATTPHAVAQIDDLAAYLPPHEVHWLTPGGVAASINDGVDAEVSGSARFTVTDAQTADAKVSAANAAIAEHLNHSSTSRILLLQQENRRPEKRGYLLLIPEMGTHPFQSSVLRHWYQAMPSHGWTTLALQSPLLQVTDFEWDANFGERYSPANDISMLLADMRHRLLLALEHIATQDGQLVVVAEGVSGALLVQLLTSPEFDNQGAHEFDRIAAVVLVGGYFPQYALNRALALKTAQLDIPVLDIIPARAHAWVTEQALNRSQHSQRLAQPSYRQRVLASQPVHLQPRYLLHELQGWLKHEQF